MNEYQMEMKITCATGDADHFYNTVLMIAKGFEIGILESKLGPINPEPPKTQKAEIPKQDKTEKTLSLKEAAEHLNISKGTLYKYTSESIIPHYKIGSRILFRVDEIDKWFEERKVK